MPMKRTNPKRHPTIIRRNDSGNLLNIPGVELKMSLAKTEARRKKEMRT